MNNLYFKLGYLITSYSKRRIELCTCMKILYSAT